MGINPDALFSILQTDLSDYLFEDNLSGAAARALRSSFYKKFVDMEEQEAEQRAFDKFTTVNQRCADWKVDNLTDEQRIFFNELKNTLWRFEARSALGCLTLDHLFDRFRTGPGASLKARGTDFYTKVFDSRLSCTRLSLYEAWRLYTARDPRWLSSERKRSATHGPYLLVEGNSMSFVPKTNVIKRSICTEPNINMMLQLSIGSYIEDALRKQYGLDLGIQPDKNRELSRRGSIDGSYGTIDLESASDSLALTLLRPLLDRRFMALLELVRSRMSTYRGHHTELHMVSTMGNGYTFPLQTLLFAGVVITTARMRGHKLRYPRSRSLGSFGVFGDDIIVERELYDDVVTNLETLGFKVNRSKSFNEGPFRESCGHDYFDGQNIRGVYVKTLTSVQDRFVLVNRLNDWTARTGIPVRRTIAALLQTVPFFPVPLGENDDAGIRVPYLFLRKRVRDKNCQSILYRRWQAVPHELKFLECGRIISPKGERRRQLNVDGAYLSFLQGSIRANRLPIRHDRIRYAKRIGISPNWDYIPMGPGISCRVGPGHLEDAYLLNFEGE
nr:MAG: RNA dependent RNA polymerase [Leviviridae sp.]